MCIDWKNPAVWNPIRFQCTQEEGGVLKRTHAFWCCAASSIMISETRPIVQNPSNIPKSGNILMNLWHLESWKLTLQQRFRIRRKGFKTLLLGCVLWQDPMSTLFLLETLKTHQLTPSKKTLIKWTPWKSSIIEHLNEYIDANCTSNLPVSVKTFLRG